MMIIILRFEDFGLLVGQNKQFKDFTLGSDSFYRLNIIKKLVASLVREYKALKP